MTHGTTDPEALNDGTRTRPTLPPIVKQPRTPVKRWTLRVVGQPTITPGTTSHYWLKCGRNSKHSSAT